MKILITGANGQLGSELKELSKNKKKHEWIFTDIDELDLGDLNNLQQNLNNIKPDLIINCAAYTNVDEAEEEEEFAHLLNYKAIKLMALWVNHFNAKLIHISTDYVFNGTSQTALLEDSKPDPINVYGKSKLLGDQACIKQCPNSIILRTSWVYSSYGNNFVKTMMKLMTERKELNIIHDQIGSPTYAKNLAEIIIQIIGGKKWIPGIYNYSNEGEISWFDFAQSIKEINNFDIIIHPIKSEDYKTKAQRPKYSLLSKSKIKEVYGVSIPYYKDSLEKCIKIIKNEK